MSEKSEGTKESVEGQKNEYEPVVVEVGYSGEKRKVRFKGTEIAERSNHSHQGPNQNRWHEWTLYEVLGGKYRVLDTYHTCWQGESGHLGLSVPLTAIEVARKYPALAVVLGDHAVEDVDDKGEVDGRADDWDATKGDRAEGSPAPRQED